jgi:hypothetical protein
MRTGAGGGRGGGQTEKEVSGTKTKKIRENRGENGKNECM